MRILVFLIVVALATSCEGIDTSSIDAHAPATLKQADVIGGGGGGAICGDGTKTFPPEQCDDGNVVNDDGCTSTCALESGWTCLTVGQPCVRNCGNGTIQAGESCDDGNRVAGDGCSATCTAESGWTCAQLGQPCVRNCSNGFLEPGETCDDSNLTAGDGCSTTCSIESGWACSGTPSACHAIVCGDGLRDAPEGCDDGANNSSIMPNACREDCQPARCGDGIEDDARGPGGLVNEVCDDGPYNGQSGVCNATCTGFEPVVTSAASQPLTAAPAGTVGLLLSDSYLLSMCISFNAGSFAPRDNFLAQHTSLFGRIVELTQDLVVENPILLDDSAGWPFVGQRMFAGSANEATPLYGAYFVPAGSTVVTAIHGGLNPGCCGTLGSVLRPDCLIDPPDLGGGGPICETGTGCPDFTGNRTTFTDPFSGTSISGICGTSCAIMGSAMQCSEDANTGPGYRPEWTRACDPTELHVSRVCMQMGADMGACGGCDGRGLDSCVSLDPSAALEDNDCLISQGDEECYDDIRNDPEDQPSIAMLAQICHANPGSFQCLGYVPPEEQPVDIVACGAEPFCGVCSPLTGRGCVPTMEVPAWFGGESLPVGSVCISEGSGSSGAASDGGGACGGGRAGAVPQAVRRVLNAKRRQVMAGDPVAVFTGELIHDETDVSFPARGVPFEFRRHYRSGALRSGALGPGWSHNFEERIVVVGDKTNRLDMPAWCTVDLPLTNCLLRTDEDGGTELWTRDPRSAVFLPPPGVQGSLTVRNTGRGARLVDEVSNLNTRTEYVYELLEPGGIVKTYDLSGVLLSIVDDSGFGLGLRYRVKTAEELMSEGAWSNLESATLRRTDDDSLEGAQAHTDRLNMLNAMELVDVTDAYGRVFKFEYTTYFTNYDDGRPKRRRLSSISHRASTLVDYGHTPLELYTTSDAYLTRATRQGFSDGLSRTKTTYEYDHDHFAPGGAFHRDENGLWTDPLGATVDEILQRADDDRTGCSGGVILSFDVTAQDFCSPREVAGSGGGVPTYFSVKAQLWDVIRRGLADNIVRIVVDGDIELESRYNINPLDETYDHVVEQRYGQLPAPLASPQIIADTTTGTLLHRWYTSMPLGSFSWFPGDANTVPGQVLPLATHVVVPPPTADLPLLSEVCSFNGVEELPMFNPQEPAGNRTDFTTGVATLKRTAQSCEALAARSARAADPTGLVKLGGTLETEYLQQRPWDLNLVCEWVKSTDRNGFAHWFGMNFEGSPLSERHPSPTGSGTITINRTVNGDGNFITETNPDGSVVEFEYGNTAVPQLTRNLLTKITEKAATSSALVPATIERLSGAQNSMTTRVSIFEYEPLFQKPTRVITPEASQITNYDYQQLSTVSSQTVRMLERFRKRTGTRLSPSGLFLGVDLDGDGASGNAAEERSGQPVVSYVTGVDLAGTPTVIGDRFMRDASGQLLETRSITAIANASLDFNRTTYKYYENLAKAEAGDLSVGNCRAPCGPVGTVTHHRTLTATAADDLDVTFYAYDRFGAVRLERQNNDTTTDVVTIRDHLGRTLEQRLPGGEIDYYDIDARGRTRSVLREGAGAMAQVSTTAIGIGTQLGTCTEIDVGACTNFQSFAESVFRKVRAGQTLPLPLPGANYDVVVVDNNDRQIAKVGPLGIEKTWVYNSADIATGETVNSTPPVSTTYAYDVAGRTVAVQTGSGATALEKFFRYDRFGRLVDTQTKAPLAQTAFVVGTGTIESIAYSDTGDNVARISVSGDDGLGTRRVLSTVRYENNVVGMPRYVHRYAAATIPTTVPTKASSGVLSTDNFATETYTYDAGLRPLSYKAEGVTTGSAATWDHFGAVTVSTPDISSRTITSVPRTRTRTMKTTWRVDGTGTATTATIEKKWTPRGLLASSKSFDAALPTATRTETWTYNGLGQVEKATDAAGRYTKNSFDGAGRLAKVLIGQTADVRKITYAYDARGRVLDETASDAPTITRVWDRAGNLTSEMSQNAITDFYRDGSGRLIEKNKTISGVLRKRAFTFNENATTPNQVTVDDAVAATYSRDGLDRLVSAQNANLVLATDAAAVATLPASRPTLTTTLTYDSLGRVRVDSTKAQFPTSSPTRPGTSPVVATGTHAWPTTYAGETSLTILSGDVISKGYSAHGNLTSIKRASSMMSAVVGFAYVGGLWTKSTAGAASLTKSRDAFGMVTSSGFSGTRVWSEEVLRGPTGKIVASRLVSPTYGNRVQSHSYDALSRLTKTRLDVGSTVTFSSANRITAAMNEGFDPVLAADNTVTHTHGSADTLKSTTADINGRTFGANYDVDIAGLPPKDVNGQQVTRDKQDRITTDGSLTYIFDAFDRLALVRKGPTDTLRLAYDGLGRRRLERRSNLGGTEDLVLEYDGGNVIDESNVSTLKTTFATIHADGLDAPVLVWTGPLAATTKLVPLATNARGDVTIADGAVFEEQMLDPYGEREAKAGTVSCLEGKESGGSSRPLSSCASLTILRRFGIGGARQHPDTKLVDLRNRVYATHLRGFLTKDPLGNVDSNGLFNYVAGDPVNLRDPWGLSAANNDPVGGDLEGEDGGYDAATHTQTWRYKRTSDAKTDNETISRTLGRPQPPERPRCITCGPPADIADADTFLGGIAGVLGDADDAIDDLLNGKTFGDIRDFWNDPPTTPEDQKKAVIDNIVDSLPGISHFKTTRNVIDACSNANSKACGRAAVEATAMVVTLGLAAKLPAKTPRIGGCFVAGTPVQTLEGPVAIEDLQVGDEVLSRDEKTGEWKHHRVKQTFIREVDQLHHIVMLDEMGDVRDLLTTDEHPFMTPSGWVVAAALQVGATILTVDGTAVVTERELISETTTVYNIEVDETHTYFVGDLGAWVHNAKKCVTALDRALGPKAPKQTTPGTKTLEGVYVDADGNAAPYRALYDEFGREIERTDFTSLPDPKTHTNPHHHTRTYGPGTAAGHEHDFPGPGPRTGN